MSKENKFCRDCKHSKVLNKRIFCMKNHFNRTYVYKTCEKYDKPDDIYSDAVQIWQYF